MKIRLLILTFCITSSLLGQSNTSIEVTYKRALKSNDDKSDNPPKFVDNLSYRLIANDSVAIFNKIESMENDAESNLTYRIATRGGNGIYYKNRNQNIKLRKLDYLGEVFLITYPYNEWEIELSTESKKIGKYTCYKALLSKDDYNPILKKKTNLKITVWYTPEIPLPFGPAGYDGLPGLVLEVKSGGIYTIVDTIKFNKEYNYEILPPKGGTKVTFKEYYEKLFEMYKKMNKRKN